jgi:glucokinase-like ROK family protein
MHDTGDSTPSSEVKQHLKGKNSRDILRVIQHKGPVSRAEIARLTRLTPATVSNAVSELGRIGIIREIGHGTSQGGRRPILIELNPESFYLAGVDLGITKIQAVVTDLHGTVVSSCRAPVQIHGGRERILDGMLDALKEALQQAGTAIRKRLAGIGLSVSGLVNMETGISIFAPNIPDWRDVPVAELFRQAFGLPVSIENDARAMALGEARFGAGRGYENILCINIGHGIGSGIIIDGELYRGKGFTAGEFGHITVLPSGPICHCGNRGCIEVMAGGHAIAASAIRIVSSGRKTSMRDLVGGDIQRITAETVARAAAEGDAAARQLLEEVGRYLGIAIASAVNLLGPEHIIIGGGVTRAGAVLFDEIRQIIEERAFTTMITPPKIVESALGENASAVGAAALVLSETIVRRGFLPT